jgi:predicted transcriptional regulator
MLRDRNRIRIILGMKRENELEYLRRRLDETVGMHSLIAKASGVPQMTVSRIYNGADPRLSTAVKLLGYLRKLERSRSVVAQRHIVRRGRAKPVTPAALGDNAEQQNHDERGLADL